jgi:hypothetical protein
VRQRARKDGKLKFTALLQPVTRDLLRESYHRLWNIGSETGGLSA